MSKYLREPKAIARGGLIAAIYVLLSYFANIFSLAYGPIQCRFSEALTVLPWLFPEAIPGLFLGCLITNILSPYGILDMIFGPLATLIAAVWTYKTKRWTLTPVAPTVANAIIIGIIITVQEVPMNLFLGTFAYNALTVGIGELLVTVVLGLPLLKLLQKYVGGKRA